MDRPGYTAARRQRFICGIDDGVNVLFDDIAADQFQYSIADSKAHCSHSFDACRHIGRVL